MKRAHLRGFSLVELMIALTIGLLLTIVVSQVFLGSRRTYATTDDLARMQENMRFAHDLFTRTTRMAEYTSAPGNLHVAHDGSAGVFDTLTAATGTDGNPGSSLSNVAQPDSVTLRYQGTPDNMTFDCLGNVVASGLIATNLFKIETIDGIPSLTCSTDPAAANGTVLVSDVENMQILYGESRDPDDPTNVDRYVPADVVSDFRRVVSLRIAMLFRTPNLGVRSTPDTAQSELLGIRQTAAPQGLEATRIRRVMTVTIMLRNRGP
jgi:type IV pilus assembly protein PilW